MDKYFRPIMKTLVNVIRCYATVALVSLVNLTLFAQVEVKWQNELPANIYWQEVTSLGNLIVSSGNQLSGINTETGAPIWSKPELARLERQAYSELPNSPFFTVTKGDDILLIDQLTGDLVFDSERAGIKTIEDYFLLYNSDALLVAGKSFSDEPVMASVRMSNGSISWKMNEKFGRIIAATTNWNQQRAG